MYTDYYLYLIADVASVSKKTFLPVVRKAIRGGATLVQLRDKDGSTKEFVEVGLKLRELTRTYNIPLIVNDRVDVALAINADGVHLGIEDIPVYLARKKLGEGKLIGASVKTVTQAKKAERDGASYLGVGDIFGTKSKKDTGLPIGLVVLGKIAKSVSIPVVGIGGVTASNADSVIRAGAAGIAVISAVMGAKDPEKATRRLKQLATSA